MQRRVAVLYRHPEVKEEVGEEEADLDAPVLGTIDAATKAECVELHVSRLLQQFLATQLL